jgi:hypothetical protein
MQNSSSIQQCVVDVQYDLKAITPIPWVDLHITRAGKTIQKQKSKRHETSLHRHTVWFGDTARSSTTMFANCNQESAIYP